MRQSSYAARIRFDTPLTILLRYAFFLLFISVFWSEWQWGYGLIAILLLFGTGVQGVNRYVLVPLPGWVRMLLELAASVAGMIAMYQAFGRGWATVVLVIHLVYLLLSTKRLVQLSRA